MPAHPLQPELDALDEEYHRNNLEYLRRRDDLLQRMASSTSLVEDMPHDITQEVMVDGSETAENAEAGER